MIRKNGLPQRRSIRLPGYDYSRDGYYFVTMNSFHFENIFGEIHEDEVHLHDHGWIIEKCWLELPMHYPHIRLDAFIIMPNHFHGILEIFSSNGVRARHAVPVRQWRAMPARQWRAPPARQWRAMPARENALPFCNRIFGQGIANSLSSIIGSFKSAATKIINRERKMPGAPLWHRNYYERIIRNEDELAFYRRYIKNNPRYWKSRKGGSMTRPFPYGFTDTTPS